MSNHKKQKIVHDFSKFGLSSELLKAIAKKGYDVPTPIQRKTIPQIMCGRNVVAMAPTGSGKTAAFLLPMFERLKSHSSSGARALIISPTRELASQTTKFAIELGKFMSLKAAVLLGGESMENDFKAMHENPDIIIATPARLLHIGVEMGSRLNLSNVEYVVFDEGDRLFELGLVEQLSETLNRLPKSRQTVIFSATLPGNLVDFAKAGLHDPLLIRLDLDKKISEKLMMNTLFCTSDTKLPVLLELLQMMQAERKQAIVFFATKHHIEYVSKILTNYNMDHVMVYSGLDSEYRKINTERFLNKECGVLLVTDVASRGIDIPALPYMINFHFPDKPKLFVHRVGRVARAGTYGTAFNLIDCQDLPYLIDTYMFIPKPVKIVDDSNMSRDVAEKNGFIGSVPSPVITKHTEKLVEMTKFDCELKGLQTTSERGYKKYTRLRMLASSESVKRSRILIDSFTEMRCHPMFAYANDVSEALFKFRAQLLTDRPKHTIFETTHGKNEKASEALAQLRKIREHREQFRLKNPLFAGSEDFKPSEALLEDAAKYVVPSIRRQDVGEMHLQLNNSGFAAEAKEAILEMQNDGATGTMRACGAKQQRTLWDRKKRKFVSRTDGDSSVKRIRTESGVVIPASYKTDIYQKWLKTSNTGVIAAPRTVSFDDEDGGEDGKKKGYNEKKRRAGHKTAFTVVNAPGARNRGKAQCQGPTRGAGGREERPEQIQKRIKEKEKKKDFQKSRHAINKKKTTGKKRR